MFFCHRSTCQYGPMSVPWISAENKNNGRSDIEQKIAQQTTNVPPTYLTTGKNGNKISKAFLSCLSSDNEHTSKADTSVDTKYSWRIDDSLLFKISYNRKKVNEALVALIFSSAVYFMCMIKDST